MCGPQVGIEGAIHGINELFSTHQDQSTGCGELLIDAANAFNSLNHAAILLYTCPCSLASLCPISF